MKVFIFQVRKRDIACIGYIATLIQATLPEMILENVMFISTCYNKIVDKNKLIKRLFRLDKTKLNQNPFN